MRTSIKNGSLSGIPVDGNFFEVFALSETDHPKISGVQLKPPDETAPTIPIVGPDNLSAAKGQKQPAINQGINVNASQVVGTLNPSPASPIISTNESAHVVNASEAKTEIPLSITNAAIGQTTGTDNTYPSVYPTEPPASTYTLDNGPTPTITQPSNSLPPLASDRIVTVVPSGNMQGPSTVPPNVAGPETAALPAASNTVATEVPIPSFATTASTMTSAPPSEQPGGSALNDIEGSMILQQKWHPYLSDKSSNIYRVMEQTVVSGIKNIYAQSNEEVIPQILSFNEVDSPEAPVKNASDTQVGVHFKIMFLPGHKSNAVPIQNAIETKSLAGIMVYPTSFALKTSDTITHPHDYTSCQQLHNIAMSAADGQIGGFIPECTPDGNFKSVQCHALTGFCWCVNHIGVRITGTEERYKEPSCEGMLLTGKVILPEETPSTLLPGSCLTVSLQESILCGGDINCHLPLLGNKTFKNVIMVDRTIEYSLPLMQLKPGTYVVTAVLNVGWCRISSVLSKDLIHQGDYHSTTLHDVVVGPNTKVIHKDIELELLLPEETGINLSGDIILPSDAPATLPPGSCLIIQTKSWNPSYPIIGNMTVIEPDVLNNTMSYSMHLPDIDPGAYIIRCILHLNQCDMADNTAKPGDYFIEKKYQVSPDTTEVEEDLILVKQSPSNQGVTLHGKIKLPPSTNRYASQKSCLILQVREFNPSFGGNIGIDRFISQHISHQLQYEGEFIHYAMTLPHIKYGRYQIDAIMNVGWCSGEISGSSVMLRSGDYHNSAVEDFMILEGEHQVEYDFEMVEYNPKPETVPAGVTVYGRVILPSTAPTLYTNSCLTLQVKEFKECTGVSCSSPTIARSTYNNIQGLNRIIQYDIYMPNISFGHFLITAVINNGWCYDGYSDEWIKNGDFINEEVRHFIVLPRQIDVEVDIQLNHFVKASTDVHAVATPAAPAVTTIEPSVSPQVSPPVLSPGTSPVLPPASLAASPPIPPPISPPAIVPASPVVPPPTLPATPPPVLPNTSVLGTNVPSASPPQSISASSSDGNFDYQFTLLTNPNYVGPKNASDDEYVYRTGLLSVNSSTAPITNESDPHFIMLPNGLPKSCQGIRDAGIGNIDGQYIIEARPNCHISVICVNMDDENTKEFLGGPSEEEWRYWHYAVLIKISEADKRNLPKGACLESSVQGRELLHRILLAGSREGNPISQWKTKISNLIRRRRNLPEKVSIITKPRLIRKVLKNRMWTF